MAVSRYLTLGFLAQFVFIAVQITVQVTVYVHGAPLVENATTMETNLSDNRLIM